MNRHRTTLRQLASTKHATTSGKLQSHGLVHYKDVKQATRKSFLLPIIVQRRNLSCDLINNEESGNEEPSFLRSKADYNHYNSRVQRTEGTQARQHRLRCIHNLHKIQLSGLHPLSDSYAQDYNPLHLPSPSQLKTPTHNLLSLLQTKALNTEHMRKDVNKDKASQLPKVPVSMGLVHKRSASVAKVRQSSKLELRELLDLLHIQAAQRDAKLLPISRKQFARQIIGSGNKRFPKVPIENTEESQANNKLIQVDLDDDPDMDLDLNENCIAQPIV